ncbi:hypothetical protein EW146_g6768 [Bondarzewia mesenterica]|uniref:Uncharacterized protein n=1 Tax=Bondarzewia mesenterica TaxID=1095465 RepID=A0A4S4LNB8_9AGAM|nr:hypothetical protein EW146_g6768 [Bondarzewia mesenterica]
MYWRESLQLFTSEHPMANLEPQIMIDGYISRTFQPQWADNHFSTLLKTALSHYRVYYDTGMRCFFLRRDALRPGSAPMILDYSADTSIGSLVPQSLWTPHSLTDRRQYVEQAKLEPPTFFVHTNGVIGVRLVDAAAGNCHTLKELGTPARLGNKSSVHLRMNWPGYNVYDWKRQFQAKDETSAHSPITLERYCECVLTYVLWRQLASQQGTAYPQWRIGANGITRNDILIIGVVHVSAGSFMPILQLNRYIIHVDPMLAPQFFLP